MYLLFTDTLIESNDLYRFLIETAGYFFDIDKTITEPLAKRALTIPELYEDENARKEVLEELRIEVNEAIPRLIWLSDGIQPWDIFFQQKFLGNSRIAQCSHILKQVMSKKYVKDTNYQFHAYLLHELLLQSSLSHLSKTQHASCQ